MKLFYNILRDSALGNNRGVALLVVLALIIALSAIALISVNRSDTGIDLSYNQMHSEQAFYIAEAGYEHALQELTVDYDWRAGFDITKHGTGAYLVFVTDSIATPALAETVFVVSQGMVQGGRAEINAWMRRADIHPFEWAMFSKDSMFLDRKACTDSYNSDSGSYAATLKTDDGDIGSNGNITISKFASIGGDVKTASDSGLYIATPVTITGDTATGEDPVYIDTLSDAEFAWAESVNAAPPGLSGSYSYSPATDALTIGAFDTLTLSSGVYFFSTIYFDKESVLELAPGANVTIYMTANMTFDANVDVNKGGSPADLQFYSKGTQLDLDQSVEFYAGFYGPNAQIYVDNTAEVYGSVLGSSVMLDIDACFHFDRDMRKVVRPASGLIETVAWKEN